MREMGREEEKGSEIEGGREREGSEGIGRERGRDIG